ncbi:hypothetical protein [Clostridium sp.]|uniref:hypothetical protein n=1 Tax=Clostridium sp. TaxID=1506 RepID=UPI002FCA1EB6
MNRYFKIGLVLVLFSPLFGEIGTKIYNAILATTAESSKFSILYNIWDQFIVLIIGVVFMAMCDKIQIIEARIKGENSKTT